ncbi:NAD(P)/FAD-dependent oxidoreductase [Burkholderia cepacia]|uniref:NAD(P)/FAD-dependent oxidoreductase n=1 Tax=Burkholderia cepacia TaxID=292 RepID=UPI00075D2B48|nr:FAD-dependent oxidoreductase [Burkholderia cepacia]KVF19409.1 FAD-dependent oxidoreductase [Burkholderia cepacia]UIY61595.1 FAD-binding oxidoreductase [Burkholderia cepacia]
MQKHQFDFVVVGGGIAGVAVGAELVKRGTVLILERETSLAYHTTGRSAAISMESYGNEVIRHLTCASRGFYENPPQALTDDALCSPRGALIVGDEANWGKLQARYQSILHQVPNAQWLDRVEIAQMVPFLTEKWLGGIYEPDAFDLDVHAIHTTFLRGVRKAGGEVRTATELRRAHRADGVWHIETTDDARIEAHTIVNAAGAWADDVALACGVAPLAIQPLLRTVVVVDPEQDVSRCPYIGTVDEQIFVKPDVGRLMISPCDEAPSAPCDAMPDELGVAITMDRLEHATTLRPKRVLNRWAGLRVFAPDRSPVVGPDPTVAGFIWAAALGGYGIQTAPAMARFCAALASGEAIPGDLAGLDAADTSPARLLGADARIVVPVANLN